MATFFELFSARSLKWAVLSIVGLSTWTLPVSAEVITLQPIADAFVSSANPGNNYGDAGAVAVSSASLPKGAFESYLRFNAGTAAGQFNAVYGAGNWSIVSASLSLTTADPINSIFNANSTNATIELTWTENDSWIEGTGRPNNLTSDGILWNTRLDFASPNDALVSTSTTNTFGIALVPGVLSDIGTGSSLGFRMSVPSGDTTTSEIFFGRIFGTAASRPQLTITASAIPEPGTASMVLVGLGLLMPRRSSRRKP